MKKLAFLFPGQGAQYPGMGKDFHDAFSVARQTFQEADDLLDFKLSRIVFEGPEALLTETRHSQLAIFVCSTALLRVLQQQMPDLTPSLCAGLSLGEYTALHASKRLGFAETLHLVRRRAEFMNEACEKRGGTMAAVLGLNAPEVEEIVRSLQDVWVANFNCPGQTVISGTKEGVEAASVALKEKGAKRILPLQVHGAFHSGLMKSAQEGLSPFIAAAPLADSKIALVMNVPGDFVEEKEKIKDCLTRQVTHSVRWEQGIGAMNRAGVNLYIEIGCGKTLAGMNKKIGVAAPTLSIEKAADLDAIAGVSC